ncbi:MAG: hypothetical protein DMF63_11005 [Acidobacteria bacterium]|nr:MAG: hypothetical protein DMF63_11005 [Acidobacteriota bacterium]
MQYRFILTVLLAGLVCLGSLTTVCAQDEMMTNDEVISLSKAGLSTGIIVGKIRSSKSNFDLSTDSLIKLKQSGVHDDIVAAMLEAKSGRSTTTSTATNGGGDPNDPMSKHGYGIYLFEERGGERKMTQLAPNVSAQNRTGGTFTSSLTYGISKVKVKSNLPGRNAALQIRDTQPVFYFYLDQSSGGLNTASGIPSTPNEFAMIRFNQRSDNREVTIGKSNAFGGKGGLSDEYVVQFTAQDMGNGVFKVTPSAALKTGEYGFYLLNSGNSNASAAVGAKFFDFGVNMIP